MNLIFNTRSDKNTK